MCKNNPELIEIFPSMCRVMTKSDMEVAVMQTHSILETAIWMRSCSGYIYIASTVIDVLLSEILHKQIKMAAHVLKYLTNRRCDLVLTFYDPEKRIVIAEKVENSNISAAKSRAIGGALESMALASKDLVNNKCTTILVQMVTGVMSLFSTTSSRETSVNGDDIPCVGPPIDEKLVAAADGAGALARAGIKLVRTAAPAAARSTASPHQCTEAEVY